MQLNEAIEVFTNPNTQPSEKIVTATMTINAEMVTRPALRHLFHLMQGREVTLNGSLPDLVDVLGFTKAEMKNLQNVEEAIKERLHISGETSVDGIFFAATVGKDYANTSISLETVAKEAPELYKQLEKFIKRTVCIGRITVRARG
jgi:hypothetical protein